MADSSHFPYSGSYEPTFPADRSVDGRVRDFISGFYATSDDPSRNEEWVDYFLPDATLVMAGTPALGTDQIRRLRQSMWDRVDQRRHRLDKVFPASFEPGCGVAAAAAAAEYMINGTVALRQKDGGVVREVPWAGRAVLKESRGRLGFAFYQVFM
ncbi:hypothetical protein AAE478_003843 [Parahypoxylon ruwenzoriense]